MKVNIHWLASFLVVVFLVVSGCAPLPQAGAVTPTATLVLPSATPSNTIEPTVTATAGLAPTSTPSPTPLPSNTATPTRPPSATPTITPTPAPLTIFTTAYLRYGSQPVSYVSSPCAYLKQRWAVDASAPGTVVVPVMFHSVAQPGAPEPADPKDMSYEDFHEFLDYAHREGWVTITTVQLLGFLLHNAPIPRYSMIMIIDDRRPGVVEEYFMPLLAEYDWTLTLAYIADPDSMQWSMRRIEALNQSGRLDVQSHGLTGDLYIVAETPDEQIEHEILGSTSVLETHFGQRPLAFIWPGGNFSLRAVEIARSGGYELGFTAFSRGPLMFNWIPQGALEREIHDPLMLLPRAWSRSMPTNLYDAKQISQAASENARSLFPEEAEYYRTYCGGELPTPGE